MCILQWWTFLKSGAFVPNSVQWEGGEDEGEDEGVAEEEGKGALAI